LLLLGAGGGGLVRQARFTLLLGLGLHLLVQFGRLRQPHQVVGAGADARFWALTAVLGVEARLLFGVGRARVRAALRRRSSVIEPRSNIQQLKLGGAARARGQGRKLT